MSISKEPGRSADIPPELVTAAHSYGMQVMTVNCFQPKSPEGVGGFVQVNVMASHVPRIGEVITLEDGKDVEVFRVCHNINKDQRSGQRYLRVTASARLVDDHSDADVR